MKYRHLQAALVTVVLFHCSPLSQAADVVTRSGNVLKDVVFLMADQEAVMSKHDGSMIEKWPLARLPRHLNFFKHSSTSS